MNFVTLLKNCNSHDHKRILRRVARLFRPESRPRTRAGRRQPNQQRRVVSRCQPLGAHLCHPHCLAWPEHQFDGSHHRCHAHFAPHGPYHRHGTGRGHQRHRPDEACREELHSGHHHQCADGHRLLPHLAARRGAVGIVGPHVAHALRRAHRLLRRRGRHHSPLHARQGQRHSRRSHRHGTDAASLHCRLRTGHRPPALLPRRFLPVLHQYRLHRSLHLFRCAPDGFSSARVPGSVARAQGQAYTDGCRRADDDSCRRDDSDDSQGELF